MKVDTSSTARSLTSHIPDQMTITLCGMQRQVFSNLVHRSGTPMGAGSSMARCHRSVPRSWFRVIDGAADPKATLALERCRVCATPCLMSIVLPTWNQLVGGLTPRPFQRFESGVQPVSELASVR